MAIFLDAFPHLL